MNERHIPSLVEQVRSVVSEAVRSKYPEIESVEPEVSYCSGEADFQSSVARLLSSQGVQATPAGVAMVIAQELRTQAADLIAHVEVSQNGVLNITLTDAAVWRQAEQRLADPRLGVGLPLDGKHVVVDYSGPNIGKELHVGHLRGTNIGDALVRIKGFLGAAVIRQNHLGDWGTPVAMLIEHMEQHPDEARQEAGSGGTSVVSGLDARYRAARQVFEHDDDFKRRVQARVVALQAGDPATIAQWRKIMDESVPVFQKVYDRLGVLLGPEDNKGESSYNEQLGGIVDELLQMGIAVQSNGAVIVQSATLTGRDGEPAAIVIRKTDGGYDYATTDLAALRHRIESLHADQILYLIDTRQDQHMKIVCEAARRAGWLTASVDARSVIFGTVLNANGVPLMSRKDGNPKLMDLLDDAVEIAHQYTKREDDCLGALSPVEAQHVAEALGVGAVKYADFVTDRARAYKFDLARMVNMRGNSVVYVQYAQVRVASILRGADGEIPTIDAGHELVPAERALALHLDAFGQAVRKADAELEPHLVAEYLYELAKVYNKLFYRDCHVLHADDDIQRANRLALCQLTSRTLRQGLELIGIAPLDRM